ncbi:hypothetical protein [Alicyclobacillus sp. ALC3]|uniref:hypothetical protein n=1 Tax=Alicyclobacillus sp. ALC3 TaxID=2796143 RepID=UPI002379682F|nr:hypothetical protein [Alicyclobacillus sp. ALC3]WDL95383.1 hypothetical protein JC200_13285 [Alicyclobacillus sp. ALC3]
MQKIVWLPEDIERLREVVAEATRQGRTREDAFKQFAQENGIKSVNAVRYQWITAGCAVVGSAGDSDSGALDPSTPTRDEDILDVLRENAALKSELKRLRLLVSTLRRRNTGLRRESRQLVDAVHAILQVAPHSTSPVLVIQTGGGRHTERLARLLSTPVREG